MLGWCALQMDTVDCRIPPPEMVEIENQKSKQNICAQLVVSTQLNKLVKLDHLPKQGYKKTNI